MSRCAKCTGKNVCTECTDTNHFLRSDGKGCVISCSQYKISSALTYEKNGEKICIPDCSVYSTLINLDETKCITATTCKTYGFVSGDDKKCLIKCPTDYFVNAGKCTQCSTQDANFAKCTSCAETSGNCLACETNYYLLNSKRGCTSSCGGVAASPNEYISAINSYTCVVSCVSESNHLAIDEITCLTSCPDFTYSDSNICKNCATNCKTCTSTNCQLCDTGYFVDVAGTACVTNCDSSFINKPKTQCVASCQSHEKSFKSATSNQCVYNCQTNDSSYLKYTQDACVSVCDTSQEYYPDSEGICRKCSEVPGDMQLCQACTSASVCIKCATNTQLKQDSTGCFSNCIADYVLDTDGTCILKSACSLLNLEGNKCVTGCTAKTQIALTSIKQCVYCNYYGNQMTNCSECVRLDSCTKCLYGYLNPTHTGCVASCSTNQWYISFDRTQCVAKCSLISQYPSAVEENYCVSSCKTDENTFLSNDGKVCVLQCDEDNEQYPDSSGNCKYCSNTISQCETCEIFVTSVICTKCQLYSFIKQDGSGCVSDCWNNDGNSYISMDRTKCVASCYVDSLSYGSLDNTQCVSVCGEQQYINQNHLCKACSEISNCLNCSFSSLVLTCTKCNVGYYFSKDSKKCVQDCKTEDNNAYLNAAKTQCVPNCTTDDFPNVLTKDSTGCISSCSLESSFLSTNKIQCIEACPQPSQFALNFVCHTCDSQIENCTTCAYASSATCLSCSSGFFLSLDKKSCKAGCIYPEIKNFAGTACISGCVSESKKLNLNQTQCKTNCEANEFSNASDTVNAVCMLCAQNLDLLNCETCEYSSTYPNNVKCTACKAGSFISVNQSACVSDCSLLKQYKNTDKNKCVADCHAEDATYYLQKDNLTCATTCNVGEYKSGSECKYCSETLANCSLCNADATLCTTCRTGFYLTSTSNGCVKDCKEDNNHLLNKELTQCIADCASNSALLAVTKDKCVATCGTDIKNLAATECIYASAGCTALDEYTDTATKQCKKCTDSPETGMAGCIYCSVANICLQCESGKILTIAGQCQPACPSGYLNKLETDCVADCKANDFGRKVNLAETKCVDICASNEWFDSSSNKCKACSASGTWMGSCVKCTGIDSCLECSGAKILTLNKKGCVDDCSVQTDGGNILAGNKSNCVASCSDDQPNLLTSDHKKCVANCWDTDSLHEYLDIDKSKCIAACPTNSYPDSSHHCIACNDVNGMFQYCTACAPSGANVYCSACSSGYLKADKTDCVLSCPMGDGGKYLDFTSKYCVASCYADNSSTIIDNYKEKCVANCQTNEYLDSVKHQCFLCTILKVEKPEYTYCETCTSSTICTKCSSDKLKYDGTGCTPDCKKYDTNGPYSNKAQNKCIKSCKLEDSNKFLDVTEVICVDNCIAGQYILEVDANVATSTLADQQCKSCSAAMSNCVACTSGTKCTSCTGGYYFKLGDTGCVNNCYTDDNSHLLNNAATKCVTECASDEYADASHLCKKCTSAMPHCNVCSAHNVCTNCEANYYFKNDKTGCVQNCFTEDTSRYGNASLSSCVDSCATDDYIYNSHLCKTCNSAVPNCNKCTNNGTAIICSNCINEKFLAFDKLSCVDSCPIKYYENHTTNSCESCYLKLDYTEQCVYKDTTNTTLISKICISMAYLYNNTNCVLFCPSPLMQVKKEQNQNLTGICAQSCSSGYGPVQNTQKCEACDSTCASCSYANNASACLSCKNSYFNDANTKCIECAKGTYKDSLTSKCAVKCSAGYYPEEIERICLQCSSDCLECNGANYTDCTECSTGMQLLDGQCINDYHIKNCSETEYIYQVGNSTVICLSACPQGTYLNSSQRICVDCDEMCISCTKKGIEGCTSCQSYYYYYPESTGQKCYLSCPASTWTNTTTKTCISCKENCQSCTNDENCYECKTNYYLLGNECYDDCPSGYYNNQEKGACTLCHVKCKKCAGPTETECTTCYLSAGEILIRQYKQTYGSCKVQENMISNYKQSIETYSEASYDVLQISTEISELSDVIQNTESEEDTNLTQTVAQKYSSTLLSKCTDTSNEDLSDCSYSLVSILKSKKTVTESILDNMVDLISNFGTNEKLTVDSTFINSTLTAANSIIERKNDLLETTTVTQYSSKVYHSVNTFVSKIEKDLIWTRSAGNLSNKTTQIATSTTNLDLMLMRGKVSDPFFDLTFSFTSHQKSRSSQSSRLRQLEDSCMQIAYPNDMAQYFPYTAKIQLNSTQDYLFKIMVYYFNIFDEYLTSNISNIRSAIVQYELFAENSSEYFDFDNEILEDQFKIQIPLVQEQCYGEDYTFACRIWDNKTKKWSSDNVTLIQIDKVNAQVQCGSRSLGFFAVEEVLVQELGDQDFEDNYGVYGSFAIVMIAIAFILIMHIFRGEKLKEEDDENYSMNVFTSVQLILTIDPIFSIFYSKTLVSLLKKLGLFCNFYITLLFFNGLFIAQEEDFIDFNTSGDKANILLCALLAVLFNLIVKYFNGTIKTLTDKLESKIALIVFLLYAVSYQVALSVFLCYQTKKLTTSESNNWVIAIFMSIGIDILLTIFVILITYLKKLHKNEHYWMVIQSGGFAESQLTKAQVKGQQQIVPTTQNDLVQPFEKQQQQQCHHSKESMDENDELQFKNATDNDKLQFEEIQRQDSGLMFNKNNLFQGNQQDNQEELQKIDDSQVIEQ
eukprot:TRINITY_DN1919_c0_g1_i17.p1 TRINITY_DN1919_c0_g1~~TRINITY_DN1919_c0_g1_i17.p1  ORF type:complete len:2671 (+),score=531.96 TRINITY_DN1919_c0_g1_i17:5491-13503(+)